jgi:hypothetical protein
MSLVNIGMGLLDKTNPNATPWSVLRRAFVMGLIGADLYLLAILKDDKLREHWIFVLWIGLFALLAGLWEWQGYIGRDEEEND